MPICCDTDAVGKYWFPHDEKKPKETRPVFLCKAMTEGEARKMRKRLDAIADLKTQDEQTDAIEAMLKENIVGWKNMVLRQKPVNLGDVSYIELLHFNELWMLAYGHLRATLPDESDFLASGSQPPSAPAEK